MLLRKDWKSDLSHTSDLLIQNLQTSQWIISNGATDFIELKEKDNRVCFAKGQTSQTRLELKTIYGKHLDKWWSETFYGCPKCWCKILDIWDMWLTGLGTWEVER